MSSGLGLVTSGLGLVTSGLGLGLGQRTSGLVNIPGEISAGSLRGNEMIEIRLLRFYTLTTEWWGPSP